MEQQILSFSYRKGVAEVFPTHPMVKSWLFTEETQDEALLANAMAVLAEKNGLNANDLHHIFPAVLRMLKVESLWAGNKEK